MRSIAHQPATKQPAPTGRRRARRRRPRERQVRTVPVLAVRAMELPLVLGFCWDRTKLLRDRDPDFPRPFRALDDRSRPLWLVSDLQAYLERKRGQDGGRP